jgi:uncharacterized membrane protein
MHSAARAKTGTSGDTRCCLFPHVLRMDLFAADRSNTMVAAAMALIDGVAVARKRKTHLLPLPSFQCSCL